MTTDERLQRVERQLARVRFLNRCIVLCIVLSSGVWFVSRTFGPKTAWAESGAKVIRANKFVLEDKNGKVRGLLGTSKDAPHLWLHDENGKVRVAVASGTAGSALSLFDENGKARMQLDLLAQMPHLQLLNENGKPGVQLSLLAGMSGLSLHDLNGKTRAELVVTDGARLSLKDQNEKVRAELGSTQTVRDDGALTTHPESSLILFGPDHKVIWSAP
jgi:hypothetical protein